MVLLVANTVQCWHFAALLHVCSVGKFVGFALVGWLLVSVLVASLCDALVIKKQLKVSTRNVNSRQHD